MAELVSKSGTKSVNWDYFGLDYFGLKLGADGKPVDDGSAVIQSSGKPQTCWHTSDEPPHAPFTSKRSNGRGGQAASTESYTCTNRAADQLFQSR